MKKGPSNESPFSCLHLCAIPTGIAQIDNLPLGKYYVKETNAPNGYLVNSKEFDTELKYKDANTKVIYIDVTGIKDEEPTGKITIIKKGFI